MLVEVVADFVHKTSLSDEVRALHMYEWAWIISIRQRTDDLMKLQSTANIREKLARYAYKLASHTRSIKYLALFQT